MPASTSSQSLAGESRNLQYFLAAAIGLLTLAVYLPALQNAFVQWDDDAYIYENPVIRSFDLAFLKWAFFGFHAANWHPLTWISHAVDYSLWGLDPAGHHLTSIVLHALNTFLLVILAIRLTSAATVPASQETGIPRSGLIVAGTAGLLFGLHPLHVESVAWAAERKDLLCALFFLLSIIQYLKYAGSGTGGPGGRSARPHRNRYYLFTIGFFVLALLSKPMAVTLPLVLLILDWYPFRRLEPGAGRTAVLAEKIPLFALSLISSCLTVLAQKDGGTVVSIEAIPLPVRIIVAVKSLTDYLARMLFPIDLLHYYPYPGTASVTLGDPRYFMPLVLVIGFTVFCILIREKQKLWLPVWTYFVVTLIPVLGIVQVGSQASADRYTYLPSIGPFLIIGGIVERFSGSIGLLKRPATVSALLGWALSISLVALLLSATQDQIRVWKNTITLWTHVIEKSPRTVNAYLNRGLAFKKKGMAREAIEDYTTAISLDPGGFIAHYNLGNIYLAEGRTDDAIVQYRTVLALKPDYAECLNNLGVAYEDKGRTDRAIEQYRAALKLKPDYADAHYNLGYSYSKKGNRHKAIEQYQIALDLSPGNSEFRRELELLKNEKHAVGGRSRGGG